MRSVEKSAAWLVLVLTVALGGCASLPGGESVAAAESDAAGSESAPVSEREAAVDEAALDEEDVAGMPLVVAEPVQRSSRLELAEARGEIDAAMADIRMAEARGLLQPEAKAWLKQAREAVEAGDAAQARKLAGEAGGRARVALKGYYADMAQQRIARLRGEYAGQMSSAQGMRLDTAESALRAGQSEVALMLVNALVDEIAPGATFEPPVTRGDKVSQVTVREGDTLSEIAARPEVYGNADLWPLLLKANRGKFLRVDELPVGIVLTIDRNASQEEIDHALALSR